MKLKLLNASAIRRTLVADPGYAVFSADFDQIELRVAAGLAGETSLIEAAKRGESLHKAAAIKLFGPDYTPDQYRYTKNVNFGWLFGGGAKTLSEQAGIPMAQAIAIIKEYESTFTALSAYKRRITNEVLRDALSTQEYNAYRALKSRMYAYRTDTEEGRSARWHLQVEIKRLCRNRVGYVVTPFGRRLPVDAEKAYAGVNYIVQSTARDIMGHALLRVMADVEMEPSVLLIVHDELIGQAPVKHAEHYAKRYGELMSTTFMGVPIDASGKVYGRSWGHGYGAED